MNNPYFLESHYYGMAIYSAEILQKDPFEYLEKSIQASFYKLQDLKDIYPYLQITTTHEYDCKEAAKLKDKICKLEDMLNNSILPFKECSYNMFGNGIKVCTCKFMPLSEDEVN